MQPDRDRIITQLYNSPDIAAAIGRMHPAELQDDLRQEMFAALCAQDEESLIGMYQRGELKFWLARVMLNMGTSNRSRFYKQYRQFAEEILSGHHSILPEGIIGIKSGTAVADDRDFTGGDVYSGRQPAGIVHEDETPIQWTDHVAAAVDTLPWYERNMFRLYAAHGNNCRLVAEATGIAERNIRFAVSRARKKLIQILRSYD